MAMFKRILIALGLIAATSTAMAADGVLEINAACVAEGCFAGDNPGFPVELGQAGSSYILTSDLEVTDMGTTAIDITASGVTLDLNGFKLQGPVDCTGNPVTSCSGSGSGDGIETSAHSVVRNGTIAGFGGSGIDASVYNRLYDLRIEENGGDGINAASGTTVNNCNLARNGNTGIYAFSENSMLELTNSLIVGNLGRGAQVATGYVRDNRFLNNGGEGLYATAWNGQANIYASYVSNVFRGNDGGAEADQISGGRSMGCNMIVDTVQCSP